MEGSGSDEGLENGKQEHNLKFGELNCVVVVVVDDGDGDDDEDMEAMDGCISVTLEPQR